MRMKAMFDTNFNVVIAAVERAGLTVARANRDSTHDGDIAILPVMEFVKADVYAVVAYGSTNAIMRLIGALADDGQECLLSAV